MSSNAGANFTGTTTDPRNATSVTGGRHQRNTDQFWQWNAYTQNGRLAVSYYDRQYGPDETTGSSDISVSSSGHPIRFESTRVTSSSMPAPTQFYGTKAACSTATTRC